MSVSSFLTEITAFLISDIDFPEGDHHRGLV
jgi:hypothetical protein